MSSSPIGLTPSQLNYAEPSQWRQIVRQALDDVRCASPGFLVEDMSTTTQTVTVQVAIQERVRPASGPAQWWDVPPITNVPVVLPRGGGFAFTLPLKKGNEGLLVFCDTCFDNWWLNGQNGAPPAANVSTPSGSQRQFEVRRHYHHDCGFWPGMWSQPNVLPNYSADSLQIRTDDGTTTVVDVAQGGVTVTGAAVTLTSPESTAGSLVVGSALQLPGVVAATTGSPTMYLPVTIGGVPYKLLLQPG
jgi:hypothetical protein